MRSSEVAVGRQRGSMALTLLLLMVGLMAIVGVIGVANVLWVKRDLRKAADLAALSAVSQVTEDGTCSAATSTADRIAPQNLASSLEAGASMLVTCGVWQAGGTAAPTFNSTAGAAEVNGQCDGLAAASAASVANMLPNAVCVTVSKAVLPGFFLNGMTVSASAIAVAQAQDQFTLTTSLAALDGGLENQLLGALLNGSPDSNVLALQAVDYQGLAQTNISLAGILANLGVGSNTTILSGNATIGQLANAMVQAATQEGVAAADLNVLNAIIAQLGTTGGVSVSLPGLVNAVSVTGTSAVSGSVNAFGLLATALQVANGTHPISISSFNIQTPSSLGSVLSGSVSAKAWIAGNPPATASGPPGPSGCGETNPTNCTTWAQTNQGVISLSTSLTVLSGVTVNLPLTVYIAPATAGLEAVTCGPNEKNATVNVQTGVLTVYLGSAPANTLGNSPSSAFVQSPVTLVSINLKTLLNAAGLTGVLNDLLCALDCGSVTATVTANPTGPLLELANQSPVPLTFTYPVPLSSGTSDPTAPYMLSTGTQQLLKPALQSLFSSGLTITLSGGGLLGSVLNSLLGDVLGSTVSGSSAPLTGSLLAALEPALVDTLAPEVDNLLAQSTGLLGLSLGNAYVTDTPDSIQCGAPMLVQ